ncbi:MAG TPA: DUF429 domain-containing protein, partial [Myxococcales bacterium]|nr:DUF429 domain-containing protein [Myxococcales bacterium]
TEMIRRALGIDLASSTWTALGSATVAFDDEAFKEVVAGAIHWPTTPLTARALADAIDGFARRNRICAIAMDGPQGWRDPDTPPGSRGVGRRCEYECRTQGKTGPCPKTYPGTQRPWIEFCIEVFADLLGRPGVALADPHAPGGTSYALLECFPTSAWRSSGLAALPAKGKKPDLSPYWRTLRARYALPRCAVASHDDLQAVVAALAAAAAAGGPASPIARGAPSKLAVRPDGSTLRIEGYIWDVSPRESSRVSPKFGKLAGGQCAGGF